MSNDDTPDDPVAYAEECKERAEQATDGPWRIGSNDASRDRVWRDDPDRYGGDYVASDRIPQDVDDARFIAHARADIPRLVTIVREQREEIERLRDERAMLADVLRTFADRASTLDVPELFLAAQACGYDEDEFRDALESALEDDDE